jgi:hypothetical protein
MIPCVTNVPCPSDQTSVQAIRTSTVSMVGLALSYYSEQQLIAILGRNRNTAAQTNYDDLVWFWAKGLFVSDSAGENPAYDPQGRYGMPPWAQSQQSMCICIFDRKFAHIYFPSKVYTFTAEPAVHAAEPAVHATEPAVHATEPAVCCFARVVYRERRLEREIAFSNVLDRDLTAERLLFRGVRERTQQAGFAPLTPPRRTAGPVSINVARKLIFRKFSISLAWLATLRLLSFQSGVNLDTFAILNRHYESGCVDLYDKYTQSELERRNSVRRSDGWCLA